MPSRQHSDSAGISTVLDSAPLQSNGETPYRGDRLVLPLFMVTIFLSSFLVFSVQPMFAKMVLPLLGGSPGVWNTAMLFFQIVLLIGYIYAHLTTRLLGVRRQAWFHVTIMTIVLLTLPIIVASGWTPPVEGTPVPWLIGLFAVSVGLPFFAVATNAPLLQRWFSHTGHSAAADPYFLYGASNLGSILALLSYPFLIEPLFKSQEQSSAWTGGYAVLVGLIVVCGVSLWRRYSPASPCVMSPPQETAEPQVSWPRRLHWLALAMVPSSLLLGVTMHITTDVASIPLLWVLPLTLYLLTFVIVFARRPWLPHSWMVLAQPFFLIPIGIQQIGGLALNVVFPLLVFFVTTMVCHGELAKRRPGTHHLTEFYLWMSIGGMLGGVFNVFLAPILFDSVLEYSLMLILACLLRPLLNKESSWINSKDVLFPTLLLILLGLPLLLGAHPNEIGTWVLIPLGIILGLGIYSFRHRPVRFALGMGIIIFLIPLLDTETNILTRERSFFGVKTVRQTKTGDFNLLVHGSTIHGAQHTNPTRWKEILTYYAPKGPVGQLFTIFEQRKSLRNVATIGLGIGALACYQQPGQHWTFFEIDPAVGKIAQDTRYFHFLDECGDNTNIIYGDGRLSLKRVPNHSYDLLIVDAFSSDSIPLHLITQEALALYLQKITAKGILVFHISNSYLELTPVMANLANNADLAGWVQRYRPSEENQLKKYSGSDWVVMTKNANTLDILNKDLRWTPLLANPNIRVWTDDYSNILDVLNLRF
jgi:hypothetical protein